MENVHVVVCVTGQKTCERLIREGAQLAREEHGRLSVVHVAKPGLNVLGNPSEGEALEYLYRISSEHGADMTMIRAENVVDTLVEFAQKNQANVFVMGRPERKGGRDISYELKSRLPDVELRVLFTGEAG